ncbi:hypothetical protein MmiAt1_17390 [Methanimicrococcus sp. At1]|uniref:TIR domain-containing protein n=1 Tax=Methanimicrococcus hacksteinii TaxID=3028293 RepID=A0ABU3VRU3_9EURY|nr:TIR domain-containing protein [Methanimicrococcus sp. At1]MDV0446123.1 hypothetical protein [Methanimicrococcus sp. At1]
MVLKTAFCFDPEDYPRAAAVFGELESTSASAADSAALGDLKFDDSKHDDLNAEMIPDLLSESDITVVFIGKHTFENAFCLQMIDESFRRGNAFLAVYLNNAEDVRKTGKEILGKNPFELFYFEYKDGTTTLNQGAVVLPGMLKRRVSSKEMKAKADFVKVYDYINDNGAENLMKWIEEERQRKADFWVECGKISKEEWPSALKVTHKGGIVSFFLYYDWVTYSPDLKKQI